MALLTGMTADGLEVPVQVQPDGKLVAEGLEGPAGPAGAAAVIGGTAALPGLHPPGDENTGLYSDSPDTLGISSGGVPRIIINGNGLGVGVVNNAPHIRNRIDAPLVGTTTQKQLVIAGSIKKDVASYVAICESQVTTEASAFALGSLVHFVAAGLTLGAGSSVVTQCAFRAAASISGALSNVGFESQVTAGANNFAFFASGLADSKFNGLNLIVSPNNSETARFDAAGRLLIGRTSELAGSPARFQCASTINISVSTYADNASAKAAGLVSGDIYRKADGTLMIAF